MAFRSVDAKRNQATVKEAIGICALIIPWNGLLYQLTAKVVPANSAGWTQSS